MHVWSSIMSSIRALSSLLPFLVAAILASSANPDSVRAAPEPLTAISQAETIKGRDEAGSGRGGTDAYRQGIREQLPPVVGERTGSIDADGNQPAAAAAAAEEEELFRGNIDEVLARFHKQGGGDSVGTKLQTDEKTNRFLEAVKKVAGLNANKTLAWKAHPHKRFALMDEEQKKTLLGVDMKKIVKIGIVGPKRQMDQFTNLEAFATKTQALPTFFDARQQWPSCANHIGDIQDQSGCGSCWAVAAAEVLTDRSCISKYLSGQYFDQSPFEYSAADILSCSGAGGCQGGWPSDAMKWVSQNRLVSGSNYTANAYCKPYPFPPMATSIYTTPACVQSCQNGYWNSYNADRLILGQNGPEPGHFDGPGNEQRIQMEIMTNGPVEACMTVYGDFYYYSTGIYEHTSGDVVGAHAVKLVGWGEGYDAQGIYRPYWLVANSWNSDWGENGFFRIMRGSDMCQIESMAIDFAYF